MFAAKAEGIVTSLTRGPHYAVVCPLMHTGGWITTSLLSSVDGSSLDPACRPSLSTQVLDISLGFITD